MRKTGRTVLILLVLAGLGGFRPARAQLSSTEEERLQILSDPDALKKAQEKDRSRVPFEFFRSQVAPFDVLPLVKPHHWSTLILELRANRDDYEGILQFLPVRLAGMPQDVVYGREARLVKEQRSRLAIQLLLPRIPKEKELGAELLQPGAIRSDELWQVPIRLLPPHQMLVLVLSKEATSRFAAWNRLPSLVPSATDREDPAAVDLQRYYRIVLPEETDKGFLSAHPLTWAPISHVIWDSLPPDELSVGHQQAMLDWLHWGGQIVILGGAGPTFSIFRDSFLGPYLPGEPTGENQALGEAELRPLAQSYPPPFQPTSIGEQEKPAALPPFDSGVATAGPYRRPVPIQVPAARPLIVAGLKPAPGASTIPLGEGSPHLLAVESRVGRGRITMLTINPNDPSLLAWPGLDTLIRRVILRRPEEAAARRDATLEGPDLSWYRITNRDSGNEAELARLRALQEPSRASPPPRTRFGYRPPPVPTTGASSTALEGEDAVLGRAGVAEWRDTTALPRLSRELLERASGITVPGSSFVLKVIVAYVLAVVPLNWLLCRLVFRRREWAWILVPLLALGFAVGVERMAAYDLGYDSACDEIDLIEVQGGYPRGHLSRFASLYSTGRARYTIAYPNDPTALALPFNNERSIGGEEVSTAVWQSFPVPALQSLAVQPRSLAMFRSEQMISLPGSIRLEVQDGRRVVVNESGLELRDAVLVDDPSSGGEGERPLGTLPPGRTVVVDEASRASVEPILDGFDGPDPAPFLEYLRKDREDRPENDGEFRLVAWIPRPVEGQVFEPLLDRHRGMTAVLVHLRYGPPPSPEGRRFNLLAERPPSNSSAVRTGR